MVNKPFSQPEKMSTTSTNFFKSTGTRNLYQIDDSEPENDQNQYEFSYNIHNDDVTIEDPLQDQQNFYLISNPNQET